MPQSPQDIQDKIKAEHGEKPKTPLQKAAQVISDASPTIKDVQANAKEVAKAIGVSLVEEPKPESSVEVVQPAEIDKNGQLILTEKHKALIKSQIAPDATKEELELFMMMAFRTRLDPLLKQLYFIKYKDKFASKNEGKDVFKVSYVTSIDGYRIIAHRTGEFAGIDEPIFTYDKNQVTHCSVTVYKMIQGQRCAFTAKVKFSEYTTGKNLWIGKPETMIAKVGEAHALRKAFPQDLSGIYTSDEMEAVQEQNKPQIKMITKDQVKEIVGLMAEKGVTNDQMKDWLRKVYKTDTFKNIQFDGAQRIIKKLKDMEAPKVNPLDTAEDAEVTEPGGLDALAQEDLEKVPTMPDAELDAIDEGIKEQQLKYQKREGAQSDEAIQ